MPTVITKSIIPAGGGDFTSIAAFIAAIPADLVSIDEQWIGECHGSGETITSTNYLTGITTDATRNVIIRAAAGSEAKPDGTGYFITCTTNYRYCLRVKTVDCEIRNLGAKSNAASNVIGFGGNVTASFKPKFYDCVAIDCRNGNTSAYAAGFQAKRHSFYNCIAINCTTGFATSNDWYGINTHNCIAKDCSKGFKVKNGSSSGTQSSELINCIAYNCTTSWTIGSGLASASTNNAATDASSVTPPGSSPLTTDVTPSDFVDVANNDFHLVSGSILIDAGSNTGYSPDFDSVARDATYDIGPYEFVSSGGGGTTKDIAFANIESYTLTFSDAQRVRDTSLSLSESITYAIDTVKSGVVSIAFAISESISHSYDYVRTRDIDVNLSESITYAIDTIKSSLVSIAFDINEVTSHAYSAIRTRGVSINVGQSITYVIDVIKSGVVDIAFAINESVGHTYDTIRARSSGISLSESISYTVDTVKSGVASIAFAISESTSHAYDTIRTRNYAINIGQSTSYIIDIVKAGVAGIAFAIGEGISQSYDTIRERRAVVSIAESITYIINAVKSGDITQAISTASTVFRRGFSNIFWTK